MESVRSTMLCSPSSSVRCLTLTFQLGWSSSEILLVIGSKEGNIV